VCILESGPVLFVRKEQQRVESVCIFRNLGRKREIKVRQIGHIINLNWSGPAISVSCDKPSVEGKINDILKEIEIYVDLNVTCEQISKAASTITGTTLWTLLFFEPYWG